MIPKQSTTHASALPERPERPFKFVWPATAPDGSVGYDRPLENYFDPSMAQRLLPAVPPSRLYDTVARANDHRYQVSPVMLDPSWSTPCRLLLSERHRSLARLPADSPEYLGISPDVPGWRPRRSSYEDRRGIVGVTPKEVNTLVPYIPPIDTSFPPPSREWLDEMAKRFLADAHADFDKSCRNPTNHLKPSRPSPDSDDNSTFFDYDTDSTLDGAVTAPRTSIPLSLQQPPQSDSESNSHDADFNSNTDSDTDSDTDTDRDGEVEYDWNATPITHLGPGSRWLIPRKRPSVVIVNEYATPPPSSDDEHRGKRRRGGKTRFTNRAQKSPKTHANDTPTQQHRKSITALLTTVDERVGCTERPSSLAPARTSPPGSDATTSSCPPVSSITATALQMKQVRIASPGIVSPTLVPQPNIAPPRSPKVFPCLLDGCTQVCASAGDLQRHQQSLRHRAPSHSCLACGKSYTRSDALKRHLNSKASCKKEHAAKLANYTEVEDGEAEANDKAVQVMATSSR